VVDSPENPELRAVGRLNDEPASDVLTGELLAPPAVPEIEIVPQNGPFSPEERAQVVRWIEGGMSRNEIVRRTGRGNATITRIAQAHGLKFDRGGDLMTAALEASYIDKRAKRLALSEKLLEDAHRLRQQLWSPTTLVQLNNRTGEFARTKLKEPTFADKRNIMTAIGIAVDKVAELERLDAPQEGKQAVITLVDLLRIRVSQETLENPKGDD
jgi:transposase-like protein